MYKWIAAISVVLLLFLIYKWWDWRWEYRRFQRVFRVSLPFICTVKLVREKDSVLWGYKRYRFVRRDGQKDKRYSWNFYLTYPTVITTHRFQVKIWNIQKAKELFRTIEEYIDLPLADLPFYGKIEGDMYEFFHGSEVLFARYVAKLINFYGWEVHLVMKDGCVAIIKSGLQVYALHTVFQQKPVVLNNILRLPKTDESIRWIVATNYKFSNGAIEYAFANKILLMDGECIRQCFLHEEPTFL